MPFTKGHKINVGRKHSKETIEKLKQPNSGQFKKGSSGFTGKHTEETKAKIRAARAKIISNKEKIWKIPRKSLDT